jgi:hypothetical protein
MRVPRVQITVFWIMVAVAAFALALPWAIYLLQIEQNWQAYSEWASSSNPNRPTTYHVPYPAAGAWPYPSTPRRDIHP